MADRGFCPYAKKWNVIIGCSPVSEGCRHCYAAIQAANASRGAPYAGLTRQSGSGHVFTGEVRFRPEKLNEPRKLHGVNLWVGSMSDPFHENLPTESIASIYAVAATTDNNYMFLTKRVKRMQQLYSSGELKTRVEDIIKKRITWPLRNTWEGVSVESKNEVWRLEMLAEMQSNFRYLSLQPLLDSVGDIRPLLKKMGWVTMGNEAGPLCRQTPKDVLAETQWQLRSTNTPHLTLCYPR